MDYSYLGAGKVYLKKIGDPAPMLEVGNCSNLSFGVTENELTLQDFTQPGGGTYNAVNRIEQVEAQISMHDLSPANLARAFYGTATNSIAGTATAEDVVAYKGGFTSLAKVPSAITTVTGAGGTPTYVAGTDYEIRPGGIYVPGDSTIPAPVAGAANIKVTYSYAAFDTVEALTAAAQEYLMVFVGLNEARSGKEVRVTAHRVKFSAAQQWGLINADEYAVLEVTGKLLKQTSITTPGLSQYFKAEMVA